MNNELTDVYSVIRREFGAELEYFGLQNSRELSSFLHYNAHNEKFVGTDENYYHNVNFINLDTGKESRIFREGKLYFFPRGNDQLSPNRNLTAFSIGKNTKCITVNGSGLFIEKFNLNDKIITRYYDRAALEEIAKEGESAGDIDYIEDYIETMGINPDKMIMVDKKDGNITMSISENGEIVNQNQIKADENRTVYSAYYEFMKLNNYYGNSSYQSEASRMRM